ncbi:MAG: CPBP family glutamic-type intramembrane protease [Promethearchaeota archaeon]
MLAFFWPIYKYSIALVLLLIVPLFIWKKKWGKNARDLGWQWGKKKQGIILVLASSVLLIGIFYSTIGDESFKDFYPIERVFVDPKFGAFNIIGFILMEVLYVIAYYIPYEFFFRGFIGLPFMNDGRLKLRWVVFYQVLVTTIVHYDRPVSEIIAAFVVGFIYGPVALKLQSIRYGLINHVSVGLTTNYACLLTLQGWI